MRAPLLPISGGGGYIYRALWLPWRRRCVSLTGRVLIR